MAEALISGLQHSVSADLWVAEPRADRRRQMEKAYGVRAVESNAVAADGAPVVVLAVKPQQAQRVTEEIASTLAPGSLFISIAAGIPLAALIRWSGARTAIVRAMPNRPALIGMGATALYAEAGLSARHRSVSERILGAVGSTVWLADESQMDVVTALSGSGPAYFFLLIEALEAAAVAQGLSPDLAHRLTVDTAAGAAQMAQRASDSPATLREHVTSPGGTTEAALAVLQREHLQDTVRRAIEAAALRSAELAAQFASG